MSASPWSKFYWSDWLGGTSGLTAAERGVYITLLALVYENGGPIERADDRLARRCGLTKAAFTRALNGLLDEGKMVEQDGCLTNRRAERELNDRANRSEKASASAHEKWRLQREKGEQKQSPSNANASKNGCYPEARSQIPERKNKGAGKPAPSFAEFWEEAKVRWKSLNSPFGSRAEAENEWNRLSRRERWIAFLVLDFFAQSIRSQWTDSFRPNAKHVCRYLKHKLFREWAEHCTEDDDEAEGRGSSAERTAEQRGADTSRSKDRPADHGELFSGGESVRRSDGNDGGAECAGAGGPSGDGGVAGVSGLDRGLGSWPAPLAFPCDGDGAQPARRDCVDARSITVGNDGHRGGRSVWVH